MSIEIYYSSADDASAIPLDDMLGEFSAAGLLCRVEPDSNDTVWLVLEGYQSTVYASVTEGRVILATICYSLEDCVTIIYELEAALLKLGYSAGDDSSFDEE